MLQIYIYNFRVRQQMTFTSLFLWRNSSSFVLSSYSLVCMTNKLGNPSIERDKTKLNPSNN